MAVKPIKYPESSILALTCAAGVALAVAHAKPMVEAADQDVLNGVVSEEKVVAAENGWPVVQRIDAEMKPGPVAGYAPICADDNINVAAILQEAVATRDMAKLMLHAETGGTKTGVFQYTLGAKEDRPIKPDSNLVMTSVRAQ